MTTFMLFIYFLLQTGISFNGAQHSAIVKAFSDASLASDRARVSQFAPPAPPVSVPKLAQIPGQGFAPIVSQVVPVYKSPKAKVYTVK